MHGRPVDAIRIVVEDEPVGEEVLHDDHPARPVQRCSGTVEIVGRIGIMLGVALPLAAADLLVKASEPTEPWAYHERSLGWLAALDARCSPGWSSIARIPSLLVAPAAGVLAGGVLGNSLSAAWNGMEVPNPLIVGGDDGVIAFNLADIWALVGIFLLVLALGVWLVRNRDLLPPPAEVAATRGRRFPSASSRTTPAKPGHNLDTTSDRSGTMEDMSMSTEPLFVPALASLDELVPHEGLLSPDELEDVARELAARDGPLAAARPPRPRRTGGTSSSTRTTGWTPGSSPGCRVREPGSTITTSRASGSASRAVACART